MILTTRFQQAFDYAFRLHDRHFRKGTLTPYISHLMSVSALVLEHGGSEDEAIAGLLHDVIEDTEATLEMVRELFGPVVAGIVAGCSEDQQDQHGERPWRERKASYIAHLQDELVLPSVLMVSNADKLHNVQSILADYRRLGEGLWTRFDPEAGRKGTLWFYRTLADLFLQHPNATPSLARELDQAVTRLEAMARERDA